MEQNIASRNKPIHIWPINLWQRRLEYTLGERVSSVSSLKIEKLHVKCKRVKLEHFLLPHAKLDSK